MSKLITLPYRLQVGTKFEDSLPMLNDNFEAVASAFKGFAVENQLSFPGNTNSAVVPAGGIIIGVTSAIANATADNVVTVYPRLSLYIDPPAVGPGATGYDDNYLFSSGSALTANQKAVLISTYRGITRRVDGSFVGADGSTYYYVEDIIYIIRNADAVSHTYYLTLNQSVFTSTNSFYR